MPFLDRLQRWAEERPDAPAVVVAGRYLSWLALRDAASAALPGTPPLSVVAEPNSLDLVVSFAAGIAGARQCAVLDPTWPKPARDDIVAKLAGYDASLADVGKPDEPPAVKLADGPPDAPFLVGFTSGTTSLPKAFTRSRRSWLLSFEASIEFFGLQQDDITLAPGPLAASLNLYALAECLYAGAQFNTLTSFDISDVHAAVAFDGVTRLVVVPAMLRMLSERGLAGGVDASGLRTIICAGSKLDSRTLQAARRWAPGARIFEYYGASELSFVAGSGLAPEEPALAGNTRIGRAFPGVEIRIMADVEEEAPVRAGRAGSLAGARAGGSTELPDGEVGSIWIRSGMVSEGYLWGDDGEAFRTRDGWYTVGDQGYVLDGSLHILGRRSDMILTSGANVYPHEVELALTSVPGVASAVAVGVPDDLRGQKVVAGIVPAHGAITTAQIRNALSDVLSRDKLPQLYYRLNELPVTDRGKVSRAMLRDWIESGDARASHLG